jgi:hypothetical protein
VANKVEIIVVARDSTGPTFNSIQARARKSGEDSGKDYGTGIEQGIKGTKKKIEDLGIAPISALIGAQQRFAKASQQAGEAAVKFGHDSQEAANANLNLAKAAISVETAGRRASRVFSGELSPALKDSLRTAGVAEHQISNIAKSFESGFKNLTKDAIKGGTEAGKGFATSLSESASAFLAGPGGSVITGVLVGVVAGASPFIGAILASAVIGAGGTTGLVGGVMLASKDPRVASALTDLKNHVMDSLTTASIPFIQPVLAGIETIEKAFDKQSSNIQHIFAVSSKWVEPLANSLGYAFDAIGDGFADLIDNAGPVMRSLIDGIERVGEAIGDAFSDLGDNGPEAAVALEMAFTAIVDAIDAVVIAVSFLSTVFGKLAKWGLFGPGPQAEVAAYTAEIENAKNAFDEAGNAIDDMGTDASNTTKQLQDLADELKAQYDPAFALIDAQEKLAEAHTKAANAAKKYGRNSEEARSANLALAKAAISMEAAAAKASGTFDGKVSPALRATLKAANLTDAEIDSVAQSFASANSKGNQFAKNYKATVTTTYRTIGTPSPLGSLGSYSYTGHRYGGVVGTAASGGNRSGMTLVGEEGPELVNLPSGSRVQTAGATRAAMTGNDDSGSKSSTVSVNFTGNIDTLFATAFQKALNSGLIKISLTRNTVA